MNKLTLLLLLIPMVSFSETWICQSMENDPNRVTYIRDGDSLIWNEVDMNFKIVNENENFIIATNTEFLAPTMPSSWVLILDKKIRRQSVANTNITDTASFQGSCKVIGLYE